MSVLDLVPLILVVTFGDMAPPPAPDIPPSIDVVVVTVSSAASGAVKSSVTATVTNAAGFENLMRLNGTI